MIFEYSIKRDKRAKRMKITVDPHKGVIVTMPYLFPEFLAKKFVLQESDWIAQKINYFKKNGAPMKLKGKRSEYLEHKEAARKFIRARLKHFNQHYRFTYKKIAIRNQSTRWGSCSSNKILNFHYKLVLIDPEFADYVIVHELCHLKQMNHSKAFWDLVAETIPDYKVRRKKLKSKGLSVF